MNSLNCGGWVDCLSFLVENKWHHYYGAVVNALVFSGTNFVFSRLTDHGEKERKRHDLAFEKLQRAWDEWSKDRVKRLDFINKRLREKMGQGHTSTMLIKQCLNTNEYLKKQIKLLPPEPQLSSPKKW